MTLKRQKTRRLLLGGAALIVVLAALRLSGARETVEINFKTTHKDALIYVASVRHDWSPQVVDSDKNWELASEGPQQLERGDYYYRLDLASGSVKLGLISLEKSGPILLK